MITTPFGPPVSDDPAHLSVLLSRHALLDRLLGAEGAGHVVHDLPLRGDRAVTVESRPWRLDPEPYVLSAADFGVLEVAAIERMAGLEAVIDDLYGAQRLVAEGVVPPADLWSAPQFRTSAMGADHRGRWLRTYSVDVVRSVDGVWHAVADYTDAPSGLGYALLNRSVMRQALQREAVADARRPRPIEQYLAVLRRGLIDASGKSGPRVVVLTGGVDHPSYVEHSYIATQLGFNLVEGSDLVVRQRQVWLRTLTGVEPIDVVHRRLESHALDPMEVNATGTAGIPGVLLAERTGGVALANAHGSGAVEAGTLVGHVDDAIEALTGARPMLGLAHRRAAVDDVVGGAAERTQVLVDGQPVEMPIALRLHVVATDDEIVVVPGATGRVLDAGDDPRLPTPCIAKDVWVAGIERRQPIRLPASEPIDLIASVPTRAADSLYWFNRAAERAEFIARVARVTVAMRERHDDDHDDQRLIELLQVAAALDPVSSAADHASGSPGRFEATLAAASGQLAERIGYMLMQAASVREFLSSTTGRALGELVEVRAQAQRAPDVDVFDSALLRLSAVSGLWSESVVRGPAWHFGDYARRYERAFAVLEMAAHVVATAPDDPLVLEAFLAANDSLVAYRRRHRSDVEHGQVLDLLVRDERNPRSATAALRSLGVDANRIEWPEGAAALSALRTSLAGPLTPARLNEVIGGLHRLAEELTTTRLVTPPDPTVMRRLSGGLGAGAPVSRTTSRATRRPGGPLGGPGESTAHGTGTGVA